MLLDLVPDSDLVEVPSDDDLKEEVDDHGDDAVDEVILRELNNEKNSEHGSQNNTDNVQESGEPDDLYGSLRGASLEPLVPEPGVVKCDE